MHAFGTLWWMNPKGQVSRDERNPPLEQGRVSDQSVFSANVLSPQPRNLLTPIGTAWPQSTPRRACLSAPRALENTHTSRRSSFPGRQFDGHRTVTIHARAVAQLAV